MGAGEGEGVFRVRGRLGQELTAQAGNRDRAGAPSPPQEWVVNSSCHRPLCPGPIASSEPSAGGGARPRTRRLGRASLAKHGAPVTDPKYPRRQCLALEALDSDQVAQIRDLPGMSGGRRGRTQTQAHLRSQLPTTELSNKTVCRPDPAPPQGPLGSSRLPPGSLGPNPILAGPPPGRPRGGCQSRRRPLPPRPAGRGWEDPCGMSPPGTKATQEARCHRTPYGKAVKGRGREGKIDPELTATEPGTQPQPPEHRPCALPSRGWCDCIAGWPG